jgi:hypothetical protein
LYYFAFTHDAQPKDIKQVVTNMVVCTQEVVNTLNRLQKAVTMATGEHPPRKGFRFTNLKRHLKAYLDDIAKALQMSHNFSSNWEGVSTTNDKEDLIRLLRQLVDLCQRCHGLSYKLIRSQALYMDSYATLVLGLAPLSSSSTPIEGKLSQHSATPKVEEVMDKFAIANRDLHSASANIAAFFDGELSSCKRHLEVVKNSGLRVPFDEVKRFALQWMNDAPAIQRARIEIQLLIERVDDPVSATVKDSTRCIVF